MCKGLIIEVNLLSMFLFYASYMHPSYDCPNLLLSTIDLERTVLLLYVPFCHDCPNLLLSSLLFPIYSVMCIDPLL